MVKKFEEFINEDYFSKLANRKEIGDKRKENEFTEDIVRSFARDGFEDKIKSITIRKENGKPIVDINGDFFLRMDVDVIPFQFGKVSGAFYCNFCEKLASLEGCPKEVGGFFDCSYCQNLTSLEGCPREVGGGFYCSACEKLTSLEGCPKYVGDTFSCVGCDNLKSLKGCPEKVGRSFHCSSCKRLTSIKGCPKEVGNNFHCNNCGIQFKEDDVKSICNVKSEIFLD